MTTAAPPSVIEISPAPDPLDAGRLLANLPGLLFLDSGAGDLLRGRYSFLTADPALLIQSRRGLTEVLDPHNHSRVSEGHQDPLAAARECLGPPIAPVEGLPPFQGGVAGYLGYEYATALEPIPVAPIDDLGMPEVSLGVYDWVIAWDLGQSRCWIVSTGLPETGSARSARAEHRAQRVMEYLAGLRAPDDREQPGQPDGHYAIQGAAPRYQLDWGGEPAIGSTASPEDYRQMVSRVRDYILAGDIFQANISQRFDCRYQGSGWELYRRLRDANPAPFGAYLATGAGTILSVSPERFLHYDPLSRSVETCPIKGTRGRSGDKAEDSRLAQELVASAKDRAENVMIVDLLRNDLSRVCRSGSVSVTELCQLESHPTVHHLVSTVVGTLAEQHDAVSLIQAAFPGGSITGAPKVRAMEIIAELEPVRRQVYCGSIGYLSVTGAMDTSIAIRTAVHSGRRLYWSAGGGITAGSEPEAEYQESLTKASAFVEVLRQVS